MHSFRRELGAIAQWYNAAHPHPGLKGHTSDEVYYRRFPANRRPRYEPRENWPRTSPCAGPWALVRGKPGARVRLEVALHAGRRHLPVVRLRRAA